MSQKIKSLITTLALGLSLVLPVAVPVAVSASSVDPNSNINQGLCQGINATSSNSGTPATTGCFDQTGTDAQGSLSGLARTVINIFSIIVGIVAVIMVIYGGFRYITSGGSGEKVSSAKNTLIYAVIGLVIVALAQFLVHFVLNTASTTF